VRRRRFSGLKALGLAGFLSIAMMALAACAPTLIASGPPVIQPAFNGDTLTMTDGTRLPLHIWPAEGTPKAVIVALHGFNDYGTFIKAAAAYWSSHAIAVYAYDQRGFGDAPNRGFWPGGQALVDDLRTAVDLISARHPGVPIFALGDSMGGAVTMTALTESDPPRVAGAILVAPAVWGRSTMPFYQRWPLWITAHMVPWMTLTGRGLNIKPSDNIEMLRALSRDPKVIKATRIDTIWGLTNFMDRALDASARFTAPGLILYGTRDEIIPAERTEEMLARLPKDGEEHRTIIRYIGAYHMLLRDLGAETYWRDIERWIDERRTGGAAALPAGTVEVRSAPTRR
jgi:alpha-beta hydrolase superfamily lysophospholipase